jgi:hypothetical protein
MSDPTIKLTLTAIQARILWETVDGAADAGACDGGLTKQEQNALQQITTKLLAQRDKWRAAPRGVK